MSSLTIESHQALPSMQSLTSLIKEQARIIEEQARTNKEKDRIIEEQARTDKEKDRIIQTQTEQISQLKETVQKLCDEIAQLKKKPKRPKLRPGPKRNKGKVNKDSSDSGSSSASQTTSTQKTREEVKIPIEPDDLPEGSRFNGYATYEVQEVTIIAKVVVYKLEIWVAPDGSTIRAKVPPEVAGSHFGPNLRGLIHSLYANGMTQPVIYQFVRSLGIDISEGQIHNILVGEAKAYEQEAQKVLSAGLQEAPYIRVDDTGAKHRHKNAYCTHIGGKHFSYYKTTSSKSRLNFLRILAQGQEGYVINDAFIWHLFENNYKDHILNAFEEYKGRHYQTKKGLHRLLNKMGLGGKKLRRDCLEAGFVGFIQQTFLKPGQVLLSDRAGQFAVLDHAACWVHMERPLRALPASTPEIEAEIGEVRGAIWSLYAQVKEASLSQENKEAVFEAYDALVAREVVSPGVREVLDTFKSYRGEMLKALDHPGLPLHNNDSEGDIRGMVKFRKISGSTKSEEGLSLRDGLMTLKQTCYRLGVNFLDYLQAWFRREPIDLAARVRERYWDDANHQDNDTN